MSARSLRDTARGRPCMVRSPVCNGNPETTVLAHLRMAGISGMGLKAPDLLAAFSCSACHDLCDGRIKSGLTYDERRLLLLDGIARTQTVWLAEGFINIGRKAA